MGFFVYSPSGCSLPAPLAGFRYKPSNPLRSDRNAIRVPSGDQRGALSRRRIEGEARRASSHEIDQPDIEIALHRACDRNPPAVRREFGILGVGVIWLAGHAHRLSVPLVHHVSCRRSDPPAR